MIRFFIIASIVIFCVLVFLIATERIDLRKTRESVDEAVDKAFTVVEKPVKAKETTKEKLEQIEKQLEEQNKKLLEDVEKYK